MMPQEIINIGAAADDGSGDKLRTAGQKINDNFTELYTGWAALVDGIAAAHADRLAADADAVSTAADRVAAANSASYALSILRQDTPPGWGLVFTDQFGNFPGGITDQGVLSFVSVQARSSLAMGTDGASMVVSAGGIVAGVRDQSGNYVWYVGEDGTTHAGALIAGSVNSIPFGQFQTIYDTPPQKPIIPAQIIAAPSDGQSLSIGISTGGSGVGAVLSAATRFGASGALMLHGGVRAWDPAEDDASLVAAIESIGAGGSTPNAAGETPQSGFAEFLNELLWKENGLRPSDHGMQCAIFAPGLGSTTIAQHQGGQSLYTRHHAEAQAIKSLANAAGKTCKKLATSWRQGESEAAPAGYAIALLTLRNSDAADTKIEFGQTEELYYICYQCPVPDIALQYYLATKLSPYIKIANPIYWMARGDGTHFTATTSKQDGGYHALMFKRMFIDGRRWNAIRPLRDVDGNVVAVRNGNQVTLTFDVPSGGQLTWDWTTNVKGLARQFGHYLFAADGVTEQAVTNIEIVGRNVIRLTCAAAVPANCIWRYGYTDPTLHTQSVNGTMRDNQGDWLKFDGLNNSLNLPMHNWCAAFEETIS